MDYTQLVQLAKEKAKEHGLDPALVCAICEQESDWQPWAIRYEPGFHQRYVAPLNLQPTEAMARSTSWGVMQLMGQCARELGYRDHIAGLCDPFIGIEYGCRHFAHKLAAADKDTAKALLLWNGGGNPAYPAQVLARAPRYS